MPQPHTSHRLAPGNNCCAEAVVGKGVRHAHSWEWLALLLDGTLGKEGINYRALAAAVRTAITTNQIPGGARLPTQRQLALELGVGRTTVVSAYNLLRAEGLIRMTQGAGTWVANQPIRHQPVDHCGQ